MRLGEKLAKLREEEGRNRRLGRPLTKAEVARLMKAELGQSVSQAYLSQLESGARVHLTATTRTLLAEFFKVHPGYLVDDTAITEPSADMSDKLVDWLRTQAIHFQEDHLVAKVMGELSARAQPRQYFEALDKLLQLPSHELERLLERNFAVDQGS